MAILSSALVVTVVVFLLVVILLEVSVCAAETVFPSLSLQDTIAMIDNIPKSNVVFLILFGFLYG
jgi:hypothetical protein